MDRGRTPVVAAAVAREQDRSLRRGRRVHALVAQLGHPLPTGPLVPGREAPRVVFTHGCGEEVGDMRREGLGRREILTRGCALGYRPLFDREYRLACLPVEDKDILVFQRHHSKKDSQGKNET